MMRLFGALVAILLLAGVLPAQHSTLVYPGRDGKLVYQPDHRGDIIPDFSNCGYMGCGVKLPNVTVVSTLESHKIPGDDTTRIQEAIDNVSKRAPDSSGIRGAVLLKAGPYRIAGTLRIKTSGVILRGTGDGEKWASTVLLATGTRQRALIEIRGEGSPREIPGSTKRITELYVPVGARQITLEDVAGLQVGQQIIVRRKSNREWIHFIKMDQIPEKQG